MIIRKGTPKDSEAIAELMFLAMGEFFYSYINEEDANKAKQFARYFIEQKENQLSYENCVVAIQDHQIIASLNIYDGGKLKELQQPIVDYIKKHYNPEFVLGDETQAGEYYIDTLAIREDYQGNGLGTEMLKYAIDKYVKEQNSALGLVVDKDNPKAKELYLKLGFEHTDYRVLAGRPVEHLQKTKQLES